MSSRSLSSRSTSSSTSRLKIIPRFELEDIQKATNDFDPKYIIRVEESSRTYKGVFPDGQIHAVKRLDIEGNVVEEFRLEIEILQKYKNEEYLVSLIGKCEENQEMIIIHEYMVNGTLQDHLLKKDSKLTWNQLLKICLDVAQALEFLHNHTANTKNIIHRNLSPANIWLDVNWAAKISDFGYGKKVNSSYETHSSLIPDVEGAFSRLDPYYKLTGQLNRRTDVYAFGLVLFEVLCWRPAFLEELGPEQQTLANWAKKCFENGSILEIIDTRFKDETSEDCLMEFARIANSCMLDKHDERPKMSEVVEKLKSIRMSNTISNKVSGNEGSSSLQ